MLVAITVGVFMAIAYYLYANSKATSTSTSTTTKDKNVAGSNPTYGSTITVFIITFFLTYIVVVMMTPAVSQDELIRYMDKGEPDF